jgi:hypothetical protein
MEEKSIFKKWKELGRGGERKNKDTRLIAGNRCIEQNRRKEMFSLKNMMCIREHGEF